MSEFRRPGNEELFLRRIQRLLRHKAEEFEHPARKRGKQILQPDLDSMANEMEAYIAGKGNELRAQESVITISNQDSKDA